MFSGNSAFLFLSLKIEQEDLMGEGGKQSPV